MIYFIRAGDGAVKIGKAKNSLARLKQLQTGQAERLSVIREMPGDLPEERWLHQYYAGRHLGGEWYRYSESMMLIEVPEFDPPEREPRISRHGEIKNKLYAALISRLPPNRVFSREIAAAVGGSSRTVEGYRSGHIPDGWGQLVAYGRAYPEFAKAIREQILDGMDPHDLEIALIKRDKQVRGE